MTITLFWGCQPKKETVVEENQKNESSPESSEQITEDPVESEAKPSVNAGQLLLEKMKELDAKYPATIGFVLFNKSTEELIELNADHVFTSASLYKLYVTYAILMEIDNSRLTLDTVMNPETGATVNDYLIDTITLSGNESAIALANRIGWRAIEYFIQEKGFTETTFNTTIENDNVVRGTLQTTPENVTDFLNRLMEGELLSEASTDYFMGLLADQQLDYALNTGLSSEVDFAHKTGLLEDLSHDAGIITDANGQEYIVVVMSQGWEYAFEDEATPMFVEAGQSIMKYLEVQE